MNTMELLEKLEQAELTATQQDRLFSLILAVFGQAIDARSPKNRPPGKAGLRAEKGYYRLLYLEGDFQEKVTKQDDPNTRAPDYDWGVLAGILRQLKDLPELQGEIMQGIEDALLAVTDKGPGE